MSYDKWERRSALSDWGWGLTMVGLMYVVFWLMLSAIDRGHCTQYQAEYSHTTMALTGYCRMGGVEVPAYLVGRE